MMSISWRPSQIHFICSRRVKKTFIIRIFHQKISTILLSFKMLRRSSTTSPVLLLLLVQLLVVNFILITESTKTTNQPLATSSTNTSNTSNSSSSSSRRHFSATDLLTKTFHYKISKDVDLDICKALRESKCCSFD